MAKRPPKKPTPQLLTPNQERFSIEYIKDRNGARAAIRAGYSAKTAAAQASRLLKNVNIRAKIREHLEEQFKRTKLSADLIIKELLKISTVDIRDAYDEDGNLKPINELPEPLAKAISSIEVEELFDGRGDDRERVGTAKKIKLWNKNEALRDLGRHLKMFTDITEHKGLEKLADKLQAARKRIKRCK